jgi:hypothetical protein
MWKCFISCCTTNEKTNNHSYNRVNLENPSMEEVEEDQSPPSVAQDSMSLHNLLSLPHFPTRQTRRKEPLVDCNMSHVIIFEEYLNIM